MDASKALEQFVAALRDANPGMSAAAIGKAAREQLKAALGAPSAVEKKQARPRPSGASAPPDVPLAP